MLEKKYIKRCKTGQASLLLLVKKPDKSYRVCLDYRILDLVMIKNIYPLPLVNRLIQSIGKNKIFSKTDLRNAYYHVRVNKSSEKLTAFRCHKGTLSYRAMLFGLCNAPSVFQAMLEQLFEAHLYKKVVIYLDDILIMSEKRISHLKLLDDVFKILIDKELHCKREKCSFFCEEIEYIAIRESS
jgi:putative transposase